MGKGSKKKLMMKKERKEKKRKNVTKVQRALTSTEAPSISCHGNLI